MTGTFVIEFQLKTSTFRLAGPKLLREVDLVQGRIDRRTDRIESLEQDSDDLKDEVETLKGQVRLSLLELGDSSS